MHRIPKGPSPQCLWGEQQPSVSHSLTNVASDVETVSLRWETGRQKHVPLENHRRYNQFHLLLNIKTGSIPLRMDMRKNNSYPIRQKRTNSRLPVGRWMGTKQVCGGDFSSGFSDLNSDYTRAAKHLCLETNMQSENILNDGENPEPNTSCLSMWQTNRTPVKWLFSTLNDVNIEPAAATWKNTKSFIYNQYKQAISFQNVRKIDPRLFVWVWN